jgi:tRNA isopentenyl-2-thiomethyl-A-37 hydroxylase MiaE
VVEKAEVDARAAIFLAADKELIESEDSEFRFHSGAPV